MLRPCTGINQHLSARIEMNRGKMNLQTSGTARFRSWSCEIVSNFRFRAWNFSLTLALKRGTCSVVLIGLLVFSVLAAYAAEPQQAGAKGAGDQELVKQTQNPVADLISVPFQNNFNFSAGPDHNHQIYLLNIQPVVPFHLSDDWNLITRTIMPVI